MAQTVFHQLNISGPAGSYTYDIPDGRSIIGRQAVNCHADTSPVRFGGDSWWLNSNNLSLNVTSSNGRPPTNFAGDRKANGRNKG